MYLKNFLNSSNKVYIYILITIILLIIIILIIYFSVTLSKNQNIPITPEQGNIPITPEQGNIPITPEQGNIPPVSTNQNSTLSQSKFSKPSMWGDRPTLPIANTLPLPTNIENVSFDMKTNTLRWTGGKGAQNYNFLFYNGYLYSQSLLPGNEGLVFEFNAGPLEKNFDYNLDNSNPRLSMGGNQFVTFSKEHLVNNKYLGLDETDALMKKNWEITIFPVNDAYTERYIIDKKIHNYMGVRA